MPRRARCVLPGIPYHVTQRGVDRRETFSVDEDRRTYLHLLQDNLSEADVRIWGWCLMTNHVHLVLVPGREESLSVLFRRVHGRYAQYYNARRGRSGHLWQNRFFSWRVAHPSVSEFSSNYENVGAAPFVVFKGCAGRNSGSCYNSRHASASTSPVASLLWSRRPALHHYELLPPQAFFGNSAGSGYIPAGVFENCARRYRSGF